MKKLYKFKFVIALILVYLLKFWSNSYWKYKIVKKINIPEIRLLFTLISFIIIGLIFIPKNLKQLKEYKAEIILFFYFILLEIIFFINHNLEYTNLFFFSIVISNYTLVMLLSFLPTKIKNIFYNILIIFIPFYMIAQTIYIPIFANFFSFNEAVTLKEGIEFATGVVSFNFIYIVYIILCALMLYVFNKKKINKKNKFNYRLFLIVLFLLPVLKFNMQRPIKEARMHTSDVYLYKNLFNNNKFISRFGISNYIIRDLYKIIKPMFINEYSYNEELDKYFQKNQKENPTNDYTGLFEGKNLIFIMAESFDEIAIDKDITPNIYNFFNESIVFNNHFVPVYPRTTCDSEIIYNTSIIPSLTDGPTCYSFNKNSYKYSLAKIFKDKGYNVNAFHSNSKDFYTRETLYKGFGYNGLVDQKDLNLTNKTKRYDSIFLDKAKNLIAPKNEKFMSFIITLSGHSPYNSTNLAVEKHYDAVKPYFDDETDDRVISYIATQIELDLFLKHLMEYLTKENIIDDTVILLTTDHYPYTLTKNVYEKHTNITEEYLKNKSPLAIWASGLKPKEINQLSNSFDVLPTLANLFNLKTNYSYYIGNDIFNETRLKVVYYKDYSWFDGKNYIKNHELIKGDANSNYVEETSKIIDDYYDISIKILRSNYFKNG